MTTGKLLNLNVEIKDLPAEANRILNTHAMITGKFKWQVIREALIFYAEHLKKDIPGFAHVSETPKRNDRRRNSPPDRGNEKPADVGEAETSQREGN